MSSAAKKPIYSNLPTDIEGYDTLADLALDLRWSWNHGTEAVWRKLDDELWGLTHNPWVVLQTASRDRIEDVLSDPTFRKSVDDLVETRRRDAETPSWFSQTHTDSPLTGVAYFSMEFMLSEALPIYSGGLGNVAGDQLKAASDLGVPVFAVGLLYQQGYFRQVIDRDGAQQALYPYNDPGQLPITPLRDADGEWMRLEVALPGYHVYLRAWHVQVGKTTLYLLDSNDAANFPAHRGITSELYGGGPELRLKQELILGIGGWRLLEALGIKPEVCHLNEGHAAFAVLERARSFMRDNDVSFASALAVTRAGNLFTTHTAVAAGFDRFSPDLIAHYMTHYAEQILGIGVYDLLALGRQNPNDKSESFNMAYLAMRGSGAVNGVSQLHGHVSRELFNPLFPRWPAHDVPIDHVTNGVHMPSWDSAAADKLWCSACGEDRWLRPTAEIERSITSLSNDKLWEFRNASRLPLIEYARHRFSLQLAVSGRPLEDIEAAKHIFDPNALTIGFARRFATYKRPNLLLHDQERLLRLLTNSERPVQIIVAGKAHPADRPGQALIKEWTAFDRRPEASPHVIFLSDYDMNLTKHMVQGVDIWLNTPRRPWEASGTSGMKVLVNGAINISELDGWWAEAYLPEVGWALGDGNEHGDDPAWDAAEANALYELLEREVIPQFYNRDEHGIPVAWVNRMRESMARLTPRFSAIRTVKEYTELHYLPAAEAYLDRAQDKGAFGNRLRDWQHALDQKWQGVYFEDVTVTPSDGQLWFDVQITLNGLTPGSVHLELYAEGLSGSSPERIEMHPEGPAKGSPGTYLYKASIPASRPAEDYTPRAIPQMEGVMVPLEDSRILWQR